MVYPIFSIAIATFNSEKTLIKTLESLKRQTYPQNRMDVMIIDGGSNDKTLKIAKRYQCRVIPNPKTDIIYAKQIGFQKAKGKYLMFLDSDEVLENNESLLLKHQVFSKNPKVKAILISGYKTPKEYSDINYYINDFGDPFSYFIYRESKGSEYLLPEMINKYHPVKKTAIAVMFDFKSSKSLPLIELFAGGCAVELSYCRQNFPQIGKNPELIALLFYLLNEKGCQLAVTKNDATIHYSSPNIRKYLKKIASRVKNNIFATSMGKSGFTGRETFQPIQNKQKKYLFIPYVFTIVLPSFDAVKMAILKRNSIYLWHLPLSIYTAWLIIYYYSIKIITKSPQKVSPYGS